MGREIRKVPLGWKHPKDENGSYIPKFNKSYSVAAKEWLRNCVDWDNGCHKDQRNHVKNASKAKFYWDWESGPPNKEGYLPDFKGPCSCYQIYETVTEGTPVSPVFETREEMRAWIVSQGYSPLSADGFIDSGWAPSFGFLNGGVYSDIAVYGARE